MQPQSARSTIASAEPARPAAGEHALPSSRAQALALRASLDEALARPGLGPHGQVQAWDSMLRTLAAQVHTLSAERGELLSGARDAYVAYIERLEAKLREREAAAVDQALVRSERQRLEVEASLAALEEKIVRTEQKEQGEAKRAYADVEPRTPD